MVASTHITNTEIFAFIAALVFKLLINLYYNLWIVGMLNFQDTFETRKR